jgi:hypothetical protein
VNFSYVSKAVRKQGLAFESISLIFDIIQIP